MAVVGDILRFIEAFHKFDAIQNPSDVYTLARRCMWYSTLLKDIGKELKKCSDELDNGVISVAFSSDFWTKKFKGVHLKGSYLEKQLEEYGSVTLESLDISYGIKGQNIHTILDFRDKIEMGIEEMNAHLKTIKYKMGTFPSEVFAKFYFAHQTNYDDTSVKEAHINWLISVRTVDYEKLRARQIELIFDFLKKSLMDHDVRPNMKDVLKIDMESIIADLPIDYELPKDYEKNYAKMSRYLIDYEGMLVVNYNEYGRFVCSCFEELTSEQRKALYDFDHKLRLVHEEMIRLKPELAVYLKGDSNIQDRKYAFAIVNSLSRMINTDWFYNARTDKKYDAEWVTNFLNNLMTSTLGSKIDEEWERANKRPFLKAAIIGGLYEAGVIKGSKLGIAKDIVNGSLNENKKFSIYMYKAKKEGYCDWICEYVNH